MPARARLALEPRGLDRTEAAGYVGVGVSTFDAMVADGRMPTPTRIGARVLWDRRSIDAALDRLFGLTLPRAPETSTWDDVA